MLKIEKSSQVSKELMEWIKDTNKSSRHVDQKLTQNMDMFNERLDKAATVMMGVQKSIGEFSEIGRSMKQLQHFLQSPKLRGNIGEQVLKELLSPNLPKGIYALQLIFQSGERVDAVIKTTQVIIPIDSKFPLSSFRLISDAKSNIEKTQSQNAFVKDVKKHILSISSKYILVSEGTLDYALMYIPSESVYYEIINDQSLFDYASKMHVVPVSPMSFYAYLKVILISHEGARIQTRAKEIIRVIQSIRKEYEKTDEMLSVLVKHINNAYNQISSFSQKFNSFGQKLESIDSTSLEDSKMIE